MTVSNTQLHPGMPWQEYVRIKAHSFSGLKNPGVHITPTPGMMLGTRVDNYLFEPHLYDGTDYKIVKACASAVRSVIGNIRPQVQLAVTANFEHSGYIMPVRGRLDMRVPGLVIDMKVSSLDAVKAIQHFRYDWQLGGYAEMTRDCRALIISVSPKTFKTTILNVPYKLDWWEHQIISHGANSLSKVRIN